MKFGNIRHIIFDLDGVLIDSSEGVIEATNFALVSMNEKARLPDEIKKFIGYPLETMFDAFSDGSYKEFWKLFQQRASESVVKATFALDGANEVLHELSNRGYILGIGTTKISLHIKKILNKMDWTDLFAATLGSDQVSRVKPDPEVFEKVRLLMEGQKDSTVVVGDTVNDIYAAQGASLGSIGVKSPFGGLDSLEKSHPDLIIDNIKELLNYFAKPPS